MVIRRNKLETVKGYRLPPPRLTLGAVWAGSKYFLLPFLLVLGGLDAALYVYFKEVLGRCYGIFCLF